MGGAPQPDPQADACIVEVTEKNFQELVVQASIDDGPVMIDFYADWCGPCKEMTPKLERAVLEAGGTLRLAKCDIDANPALAQAFKVTSIPHVVVVYQGKLLHQFVGAKNDEEIDQLLTQYEAAAGKSNPKRQLASALKSLDKGEVLEAKAMFTAIKNNTESAEWTTQAQGGLALCAAAEGEMDEAKALLSELDRKSEEPTIKLAIAKVDLMMEVQDLPATQQLQDTVATGEAEFDDVQGLAFRLFTEGKKEEAIKTALMLVKKAKWRDEGKGVVLRLLNTLQPGIPSESSLASDGRKRLGAALFN